MISKLHRRHRRRRITTNVNVGFLNLHGARKAAKWAELYATLNMENISLYGVVETHLRELEEPPVDPEWQWAGCNRTGASSGIGQATAVHFASLGSWLVLNGRRKDALDSVAKLCHDKGVPKDKVLVVVGDVCKEDNVAAIVNETLKHFGKIDILVNSAGIIKNGSTENTPLSAYDELMNVNLRSVFHMMQLAIPHLKKTKGTIVNVSSVTGLRAFPNVVAYNISKAGLDQLTRTAALELAADGVRVNAVNPGVIVTEVHKRGGMTDDDYAKFLEHCKTTHAMGRVGTADEVARAIAFLASDDSSFVTGQTLAIDGGRSIMCPR